MGAVCGKAAPQADAADASLAYSDEDNDPVFQPVRAERRVSEPQVAPATPSAALRDAGGAAAAPLSPAWPEDAAPDALAAGNAGSAIDVARAEPPVRLRWQRGELLGTGAFGRVYLGLNEETGELLAVKEVLLSGGTMAKATEQLRSLEAEVGLLRALSHPNIVRYIGTERTQEVRTTRRRRYVGCRCGSAEAFAAQALHIFLEFVPGGSIAGLLSKFGPFAERVVAVYTRQILEGLAYLHRNQIMHRDIKGANILVDNTGVVKLADFGASRQLADLVTMESGFKSMKGTPYWMAPEVIKQTGHGRQADIWSVGCTALEMVTAKPPWGEYATQVSALFHIASAKGPPPLPAGLSPEALDFMLLCFNRVPKDRPNAVRLLQHPFVAAVGDVVRQSTAGASASASLASTPTAGAGFRRTVSTIPEGISPSPSTEAAASAPRFTPADPLSSMGTSASEKTSSPAESDEQAMESLRRRLQLDASADAEGPAPGGRSPDLPSAGASSALSPNSLDSAGGSPYNPMQEPSWSPGQSLADLRQSPAGSGGGNGQQSQPIPVAASLPQSPGLPASPTPLGTPPSKIRVTPRRAAGDSPVARAVAALEKSTLEQAAKQEGSPVKGRSAALPPRPAPPAAAAPLSTDSPLVPLGEPRASDSLRVSDETIDSLLARAEQESVAARDAARMEMRRSKQAQWEAELQRELDAQREEKRGRRSGA
jgi:serine/threonine protein kinase